MQLASRESTKSYPVLHKFLISLNAPDRLPLIKSLFAYVKQSLELIEQDSEKRYKFYRKLMNQYTQWLESVEIETQIKFKLTDIEESYGYYYLTRLSTDLMGKPFKLLIELIQYEVLALIFRKNTNKNRQSKQRNIDPKFTYRLIRKLVSPNPSQEFILQVSDLLRHLDIDLESLNYGDFTSTFYKNLHRVLREQGIEKLCQSVDEELLKNFCQLYIYLKQGSVHRAKWVEALVQGIGHPHLLADFELPDIPLRSKEGWRLLRNARQNQLFNVSFDYLSQEELKALLGFLKKFYATPSSFPEFNIQDFFPVLLTTLTGWFIRNICHVEIDPPLDDQMGLNAQNRLIINTVSRTYCFYVPGIEGLDPAVKMVFPLPVILAEQADIMKSNWQELRLQYSETSVNATMNKLKRSLGNSRINIQKLERSFLNHLVQRNGLVCAEWMAFSRYLPCNTRRYTQISEAHILTKYRQSIEDLGFETYEYQPQNLRVLGSVRTLPADKVNSLLSYLHKKTEESKAVLKQGIDWSSLTTHHYWFSCLVQAVLSLSTNHRPVKGAFGILPNYREELGFAFVSDKASSEDHLVSERILSGGACTAVKEYKRHLKYLAGVFGRYKEPYQRKLQKTIMDIVAGNPRVSAFFVIEDAGIRQYAPSEWFREAAKALNFEINDNFYRHNWATWCEANARHGDIARLGMGHEEKGQFFLSRYTGCSIANYVEYVSPAVEGYLAQFPIAKSFPLKAKQLNRGGRAKRLYLDDSDKVDAQAFTRLVPAEVHRQEDRISHQRRVKETCDDLFISVLSIAKPKRPLEEDEYNRIIEKLHNAETELSKKWFGALKFNTYQRLTEIHDRYGGYFDVRRSYISRNSLQERPVGCDFRFGELLELGEKLKAWINRNKNEKDPIIRALWVYIFCQMEGSLAFKSIAEFKMAVTKWRALGKPKLTEIGHVGVDLLQWKISLITSGLLTQLSLDSLPNALKMKDVSGLEFLERRPLKTILSVMSLVQNSGFESERRIERKGTDYPLFESSMMKAKVVRQEVREKHDRKSIENPIFQLVYKEIKSVDPHEEELSKEVWQQRTQKVWADAVLLEPDLPCVLMMSRFWDALILNNIRHDISQRSTFIEYLKVLLTFFPEPIEQLLSGQLSNEEFRGYLLGYVEMSSHIPTVFNHLQNYLVREKIVASQLSIGNSKYFDRKVDAIHLSATQLDQEIANLEELNSLVVRFIKNFGIRAKELRNIRVHQILTARRTGILTIEATKNVRLKNPMSNRAFCFGENKVIHRLFELLKNKPGHLSIHAILGYRDSQRYQLPETVNYSVRNLRHYFITSRYLASESNRPAIWEIAQAAGHSTPERMIDTYVNCSHPDITSIDVGFSTAELCRLALIDNEYARKQSYRYRVAKFLKKRRG